MRLSHRKSVNFSLLKGKILKSIEGMQKDESYISFKCEDGSSFEMFHKQDCCESVYLEDVCGDVGDLLNSEILLAEEVSSQDNPMPPLSEYTESYTWTFYKLATIKGSVTLRWYGESNGYYSESVSFFQSEDTNVI